MKKNNLDQKKNIGLLDFGLRLLLVIVLLIFVFYFLNQNGLGNQEQPSSVNDLYSSDEVTAQPSIAVNQFAWKTYESKTFGFSINYPASLDVNDMGNVGGFIDFVRFEEAPSLNLTDKGIAVGVSTLSLEKETIKIKNQFDSEGGALLADETRVEYKGFTATKLYYKPEDPTQDEERIVLIVNNKKGYTYSISTVPEQMPRVMEGFNFLSE